MVRGPPTMDGDIMPGYTRFCGAYRNQHGDLCLFGSSTADLGAAEALVRDANIEVPNVRHFVAVDDSLVWREMC
jgi:hypothetical protein